MIDLWMFLSHQSHEYHPRLRCECEWCEWTAVGQSKVHSITFQISGRCSLCVSMRNHVRNGSITKPRCANAAVDRVPPDLILGRYPDPSYATPNHLGSVVVVVPAALAAAPCDVDAFQPCLAATRAKVLLQVEHAMAQHPRRVGKNSLVPTRL